MWKPAASFDAASSADCLPLTAYVHVRALHADTGGCVGIRNLSGMENELIVDYQPSILRHWSETQPNTTYFHVRAFHLDGRLLASHDSRETTSQELKLYSGY